MGNDILEGILVIFKVCLFRLVCIRWKQLPYLRRGCQQAQPYPQQHQSTKVPPSCSTSSSGGEPCHRIPDSKANSTALSTSGRKFQLPLALGNGAFGPGTPSKRRSIPQCRPVTGFPKWICHIFRQQIPAR